MRKDFKGNVRKGGSAAAAVVSITVAIAVAAGSAWAQEATDDDFNDPFENLNRAVFEFNLGFDRKILKPVAKGYRAVVPEPGRDMVKHFLNNLRSPIILANDILQGKPDRAGQTIHRFLFNTSLGLGGLFDLVGDPGANGQGVGVAFHDEDFGQTLAVWGVGEGPYLVVPILGPAPPRDALGLAVDNVVFDPFNFFDVALLIGLGRTATRAVDERARHIESLDEIEETSIDFYATIRSLYRQRRNDEIRDGAAPPTIPIPTISLEFEEDEAKELVSMLRDN